MIYLKLLYKTFYDIAFVREYTKNGKGTGVAVAGLIALIMVTAFSTSLLIKSKGIFTRNNIETAINDAFDRMPPIVIENGELVWEDDVIEHFFLTSSTKLIVDTKNATPGVSEVSKASFYLTKTDLYINNTRSRTQTLSWSDLQEAIGENPLDLTSPEVRHSLASIIYYSLIIFVILSFVFSVLFFWLINGIIASLTRTIGSKINHEIKKLDYYVVRRSATAAVAPILLIITLCQAAFGYPGFLIKLIIAITGGILLMHVFKPADETAENLTDENTEKKQ